MQSLRTILFICVLAVFMNGCAGNESLDVGLKSSSVPVEPKTNTASIKRFQNTSPDGPTTVESAIELSKKYAALSDELAKLKVEKKKLEDEKNRLAQRTGSLEQELAQAKKELSEANDLLVEMRIELNNWKSDILGFRDEMRQADKAQIEALVKILKVLGGEVEDTVPSESQPQEPTQEKQ